jgi:DNA-binding NtrC family response regulator
MQPFIQINCGIAGLSSMKNLLSYGKQLLQNGAVLCFELLDLLDLDTQAYLCEALDDGAFASCRFLATARPRISKMVADGTFSEPLFHFFSELWLTLPDVSMIWPDLQRIVNLYIMQANNRYGRQLTGTDDKALDLIKKKVWKSNFAQLQQTVHQAVLMSKGFILSAEDMRGAIAVREINGENGDPGISLDGTLQAIEMRILHKVLKEEGGNMTVTADRLGIARSTLWRKLREPHSEESLL